MKSTLLVLLLALMGTFTQSAMAQTPAETRAKNDAEKLAKELGLDTKQKDKVYQANLEFEKELEKLDKAKLTKEEKAAKKELLRQKQLNHLKTVLKPEQYEKVAAKLQGKPGKKVAKGSTPSKKGGTPKGK